MEYRLPSHAIHAAIYAKLPKQPSYSEKELAGFLNVARSTVSRYRVGGLIDYLVIYNARGGQVIRYLEVHIWGFLYKYWYPESLKEEKERQKAIIGILACMRLGHCPFLYNDGECSIRHWLNLTQWSRLTRYNAENLKKESSSSMLALLLKHLRNGRH